MLGDGGLGKLEAFPDMLDIAFIAAETGDDFQADRVPHNLQNFGLRRKTSGFIEFVSHFSCPDDFSKTVYINSLRVNRPEISF